MEDLCLLVYIYHTSLLMEGWIRWCIIELSVTSFVTVCITTGRNIILAMSYLLLTGGTNPRMMATR